MLLEFWYHGALIFLTTLIAFLVIFSLTKQRRSNLPPSPFSLPIIGHIHHLGPLLHHSFHKLSNRYGPLMHLWLGSVPCVIVSSPDLAKEFLKTHELNFSSRKHSIAIDRLTYNSAFAFAPYGPYWKFIKKLTTAELVGHRTLNNLLPLRNKEYRRFLQTLNSKSKNNQAVNVTEELLKLTNSVICQMMLSIRCTDTNGQAEEARSIVRDVTKIFGEFNVSDLFWFFKNLDLQGFGKRVEDIFTKYDTLMGEIIANREEVRKRKRRKKESMEVEEEDEDGHVMDFLDVLLDVMEDENSEMNITKDHIKALILDFFTAATDTTAIAIEWALAELINNPNVLQKARNEIDEVIGKTRIVQECDNQNLPYIQAIIKETLRLHPPIPLLSRKSTEPCNINGYNISKDTLLFVNIWSIGRNPMYWDNPLKFWPERFVKDSGEGGGDRSGGMMDIKGQSFELLPFGTGRRGCPGINLAMQELPTILGAMIQCFDWHVARSDGDKMDGDDCKVVDMTERSGLTAPRVHDFVCHLVTRVSENVINS